MRTSKIENCFTVPGFTLPCLDCTNGTNVYAYKQGIAQSDKDGYGQGKASDLFRGDRGGRVYENRVCLSKGM